ncbi:MAG: aminoacyl-tRNA hydrolase [Janthinobacterium lividum]
MQIFAGLGNPGAVHAGQRHNIGFMAADALHARWRFDPWRSRFQGLAADGRIGTEKVVLLKPATFMNDSGRSVGEALRFFKLGSDALTVLYDELDLVPFKVRVKRGGGAAGHNGIRSIDAHLSDPEYRRVRLGIGHPGHKDRVLGYVLGNFAKAEIEDRDAMLGAVAAEAEWLVKGDDVRFTNDVALRQK